MFFFQALAARGEASLNSMATSVITLSSVSACGWSYCNSVASALQIRRRWPRSYLRFWHALALVGRASAEISHVIFATPGEILDAVPDQSIIQYLGLSSRYVALLECLASSPRFTKAVNLTLPCPLSPLIVSLLQTLTYKGWEWGAPHTTTPQF